MNINANTPVWIVFPKNQHWSKDNYAKAYWAENVNDAATQYVIDGANSGNSDFARECQRVVKDANSNSLTGFVRVTTKDGGVVFDSKVHWSSEPKAVEAENYHAGMKESEFKDLNNPKPKGEKDAPQEPENKPKQTIAEQVQEVCKSIDPKGDRNTEEARIKQKIMEVVGEGWSNYYYQYAEPLLPPKQETSKQEEKEEKEEKHEDSHREEDHKDRSNRKFWDFDLQYRENNLKPTPRAGDLRSEEYDWKYGTATDALNAGIGQKSYSEYDVNQPPRKWVRDWIKEYNTEKGKSGTILGQAEFILDKLFQGQVKIAAPFIGDIGAHPLKTLVQSIVDAVYGMSAMFNVTVNILQVLPEWLRLQCQFLRDIEDYQKKIVGMMAPVMELINDDLVKYINEQKEIAGNNWNEGLPLYTEPNSPEQLQSIEALYALINNPFTGYKYKGILEHARLKHYQDVQKVGFSDGWAMLDYVLDNKGEGMIKGMIPQPMEDLKNTLPPDWYLTGNAPKAVKEAFKAEHNVGHKQIKDINRKGGTE